MDLKNRFSHEVQLLSKVGGTGGTGAARIFGGRVTEGGASKMDGSWGSM